MIDEYIKSEFISNSLTGEFEVSWFSSSLVKKMTSLDFNFAEPIASYEDSVDDNMDTSPQDIGSIQKSDFVVLNRRPLKVMEATHSHPGKHGHSKVWKQSISLAYLLFILVQVHLVGIDIFTGRRDEYIRPTGHMIQVPKVTKKDYLVVNIEQDGYVTLLNEDTCKVRSDLKLKKDAEITRRVLDTFNKGNDQMKVTVLKALGEEHIVAFKTVD